MAEIETRRGKVYRLTDAEREAVQRALDDVEQGRFASEDHIAAILRKAQAKRS